MEIAIPKRPVVVRGRVIWSNLVINRSENKVSKKGLSIIRIAAEDRAWLNSAILGDGEKFGISPKGDEKGVPMPPDRRTSWWLLDLHRGLKGGFLSNRNRPGQKAAPHQGNRQLYK